MKQIIVIRADLNMRKGKMVAQGAHASMGAILPYVGYTDWDSPPGTEFTRRQSLVSRWLGGSFTKVCVRVDSEYELIELHDRAEKANLITCLITDNGKTEFNDVPTVTCCAIGPDTPEKLDPITGHLKLL